MAYWKILNIGEDQKLPTPRWGHCMCLVKENIYIFGGYQNSKYYNDLWKFDLKALTFEKMNTIGTLPPPCSNFTMNYYQKANKIIVFGGGTVNKSKLNGVFMFDISNSQWTSVQYQINTPQPWQRSYHCAEIIGDYLVIFGGEFTNDLDDTWIFDLATEKWKEIKFNQQRKPVARKFASSFTYNNRFYIIGGCFNKYQSLPTAYYIDFSSFLESGDQNRLQWVQAQFKGKELISRWGHVSICKNDKVYIYGGRDHCKDLQNLVQIDLLAKVCVDRRINGKIPEGRRRPSICMRNHTLFFFSGFNGTYLKDFIFISLLDIQKEYISIDYQGRQILQKILLPENIEENQIKFQEEVLYLDREKYYQIDDYIRKQIKDETIRPILGIDYEITMKKMATKMKFFEYFFNSAFKQEKFILFTPYNLSDKVSKILSKIFLAFIQFGKVIIEEEQFKNSAFYLKQLLEIAQYYCLKDLQVICHQELFKFFVFQINSPNFNLQKLMEMRRNIDEKGSKYSEYAGYLLVDRIIDIKKCKINHLSDVRQFFRARQKENDWYDNIIEKYYFEFNQKILDKDSVYENLDQDNYYKGQLTNNLERYRKFDSM